jgi:hypothetical protein
MANIGTAVKDKVAPHTAGRTPVNAYLGSIIATTMIYALLCLTIIGTFIYWFIMTVINLGTIGYIFIVLINLMIGIAPGWVSAIPLILYFIYYGTYSELALRRIESHTEIDHCIGQ